ncbi:SRPBCC domain-containing protein [Micromonospora sp. DT81.3]|uniref:SRPBCC domain-containing protein n=1 Tax=Actinomycetes TaxID=1760 RepID=UPI003CF0BCAA
MIDIVNQINATHREIGNAPLSTGDGRSLLLRRTYDAPIEDVWDACTSRERLGRWLGPVTGDLRLGGAFRLEGNAGGVVQRCDAPQHLEVTWSLGEGMDTEVALRLSPAPEGGTVLELEHSSPAQIVDVLVEAYGPGGTIGIGGGWDIALLGLDLHLGGADFDPATWEDTAEVREFAAESCRAWARPVQDAWGTSDEDLDAAVAFATSQFAPAEEVES